MWGEEAILNAKPRHTQLAIIASATALFLLVGIAIHANVEAKNERQTQRGLAAIRGAVTASERAAQLSIQIVLAAAQKKAKDDAATEVERVRQAQVAEAARQAEADRAAAQAVQEVSSQAILDNSPEPVGREASYSGSAIDYENYIRARYPQWASTMIRIMYAESGGDPNAYNPSGCSGLMQFAPGTFASVCGSGCDIWNPYNQIDAAGVMFSQGRQSEWVTY